MAGCYNRYEDEERFVILTTKAIFSVSPEHNRMPLILEPEELGNCFNEGVMALMKGI